MLLLIPIILFLALIFCLWSLVCNDRTCKQRVNMIQNLITVPYDEFRKSMDAVNKVSYEKHMWYLITFRNPRKLYPAELNWN